MNISYIYIYIWAGIAKTVSRLATAWAVRGSNPGEEEIFHTRSDRSFCPFSLIYKGYRVFRGGKNGRFISLTTHPFPRSGEIKERVELYFYSRSGPLKTCSGVKFTYTYTHTHTHIYIVQAG